MLLRDELRLTDTMVDIIITRLTLTASSNQSSLGVPEPKGKQFKASLTNIADSTQALLGCSNYSTRVQIGFA